MNRLLLFFLIAVLLVPYSAGAQDNDDFTAVVQVNSAFAHSEPSLESDRIASVFEDQELEVVGRSIDGTWFEIRRLGRLTSLGWLPVEFLDFEFFPEDLPLTNFTVGLEGPEVLTADPGFALYLLSGAMLRNTPLRTGARVGPGSVPRFAVVPVLERNQDGTWLRVFYKGYTGWVSAFTGREIPDVMSIPVAANLPTPESAGVVIIPPEIQIAQIQRLRDFIAPRRTLADNLAGFWLMVYRGEIMPCNPPESITAYQYAASDVRELPELQRHAPQLGNAVDYLNDSLDPLQNCGVVGSLAVINARAAAINSRLLFDSILEQLASLETTIKE